MMHAIVYRAMLGALLGALVMLGAWEQAEGRMEGEVATVERWSGMATLRLSDGKQLGLDLATQVRRDGTAASLADIREGDRVEASFSPSAAWLFGHKDALQSRVKEVVATSQARGAEAM